MKIKPIDIFEEFRLGNDIKSSIGSKGLFEQSRINERFYIGDQWHGAKCGNERPLVRHNVIKRIGDYKIAQILGNPLNVKFTADGVPSYNYENENEKISLDSLSNTDEINYIMSALGNYQKQTAERLKFDAINERMLKNAFITGTAVLYTYWEPTVLTGFYADNGKTVRLNGDICCEVLDVKDIVFGDAYCEEVQNQPYIIMSSVRDCESVLREARLAGADIGTLKLIEESAKDSKVTVLTKLYKQYNSNGSYTVKCVKVTENAFVRTEFDTLLHHYPLAIFHWERKANSAYGESEVTYLVPNQIAINRMITANVWSNMTTGMPIMLVNGDTVPDKITNEPGQIIKVFGSNEDVAGAVKYIAPPSLAENFDKSINTLIENTMTQSGANEVALGDSRADNAAALATMREAALMPLKILKNRFYTYIEDVSRIWVDFWIAYYGNRWLRNEKRSKIEYIPFNAERYKNLVINAKVEVSNATVYSEKERMEVLMSLFEKGIIDKKQLINRMPEGIIPDLKSLLTEEKAENENERI